jgi:hypothetical protein
MKQETKKTIWTIIISILIIIIIFQQVLVSRTYNDMDDMIIITAQKIGVDIQRCINDICRKYNYDGWNYDWINRECYCYKGNKIVYQETFTDNIYTDRYKVNEDDVKRFENLPDK